MWYFAVVGLIAIELVVSSFWIKTVSYQLDYENLPKFFDGYQIVLIGDLHGRRFGKGQKNLIKRIMEHPADMIVVSGDLFDKHKYQYEELYDMLEILTEWCPVYFVPGNHEIVLGEDDWILKKEEMLRRGIHVLDDEKCLVECGPDQIELFGFRTPMGCYGGVNKNLSEVCNLDVAMLESLFGPTSDEAFQMLVSHHPDYFDIYSQWGADLTLAAHMHGGIIRLPRIGGLLSTEVKFFPKFHGGIYQTNQKKMVVTRGLGSGRYKFRFWNRPEITMIRLTHSEDNYQATA